MRSALLHALALVGILAAGVAPAMDEPPRTLPEARACAVDLPTSDYAGEPWTPAERYAWREICLGRIADMRHAGADGSVTAETGKGKIKTWATLDAAAKWVRSIGVGSAHLSLARWAPGQRSLPV